MVSILRLTKEPYGKIDGNFGAVLLTTVAFGSLRSSVGFGRCQGRRKRGAGACETGSAKDVESFGFRAFSPVCLCVCGVWEGGGGGAGSCRASLGARGRTAKMKAAATIKNRP